MEIGAQGSYVEGCPSYKRHFLSRIAYIYYTLIQQIFREHLLCAAERCCT